MNRKVHFIPKFDIVIPDPPQLVASVEDNTPCAIFGARGVGTGVEMGVVGDVIVGGFAPVEIGGEIAGAVGEATVGANGVNIRGGLKGGQIFM
jgi:hypothetical protein